MRTNNDKKSDFPIPVILSFSTFPPYTAPLKSRNLVGNSTMLEYNTSLAQTALDEATGVITQLVRDINVVSSIYVLYLAFLVIVTPPFVVYG